MTDDAFDGIMSSLDAPLVVVTAATAQERAGCLVGFHSQSSIGPERYCVWLSKANHTYRVALRSTHLAVHFLTSAGLPVRQGPGGVPVLQRSPHWLVGTRTAVLDAGGDHVCLVIEPVAAHSEGPFEPLRLAQAAHLEPGHDNAEPPS
jgi:flavin reductase (DIM6/NTAB) family NADH-FMN oxidoreductase RutF